MDTQALNLAAHVPAAARGDRDAFATLVNETRSLVSAIALSIVRDGELSRDIAQDVFLSAWRDLGTLRDPNSFLPWLRQLTRHRAYHLLRTERRESGASPRTIPRRCWPRPPIRGRMPAP